MEGGMRAPAGAAEDPEGGGEEGQPSPEGCLRDPYDTVTLAMLPGRWARQSTAATDDGEQRSALGVGVSGGLSAAEISTGGGVLLLDAAEEPPPPLWRPHHEVLQDADDGPKKESGVGSVGGFAGGGGGGGPQHLVGVGGGGVATAGGPLVAEKPSKEDEEALWSNVEAQAAFLGPNLWDRTLPYDADLKYVDLDEFLSENGIPVEGEAASPPGEQPAPAGTAHGMAPRTAPAATPPPSLLHHQHQQPSSTAEADQGEDSLQLRRPPSRSPRPESYDGGDERHYPNSQDGIVKVEHSRGRMLRCSPQQPMSSAVNPDTPDADTVALLSGCVPGPPSPAGSDFSMSSSTTTTTTGHDFDPRTRAFSDEELKPQPMIKKSKKQFVPDDLKDEKYWARRKKNNMAAKRSRDARRVKENQIALRAGFLEKENINLRQELERLKKENSILRDRLTKYTEV